MLPSVLVCPVSGHGMIEQTGILMKLSTMGFSPEVCLGASGGALAVGMLTTHEWNPQSLVDWMKNVPYTNVFRQHTFGVVSGIAKSSLYNVGEGLDAIFKSISTEKLRDLELLITAHNGSSGYLEIFSTVSSDRSILQETNGPLLLLGVKCPITYIGDIEDPKLYRQTLELVFRATSAVPVVFPPVKIGKDHYVDGGVSFSSPLNPIMTLQPLDDILYVFPEDIETPNPWVPKTAIDSGQAYLSQNSRSNYIHDRLSFLQTLCCGNYNNLRTISGDSTDFLESIKSTAGSRRMVEVFPAINRSLPIMSDHTRQDILMRVSEQMNNFKYRIFFIGN